MPRCKHHFVQVEEFNALGCTVSCVSCNMTFELDESKASEDFYPFTYTVPGKGDRDVHFLIHHSRVRLKHA